MAKELAGADFVGKRLRLGEAAFRTMKDGTSRCVILPPGTHWRQCKVGAEFTLTAKDFETAALHPENHVRSGAWELVKPKPKSAKAVKDDA